MCLRARYHEVAGFYHYLRDSGVDGYVLYNTDSVLLNPQLCEWIYWESFKSYLGIGPSTRDYDALWFLTRQISREKAHLNFENK